MIDTHIHVWNFEKAYYLWLEGNDSILNRTYHIEEIESERVALNITKGVLVQAANNIEDTDWMLEVANNTDWISGVVGWLPLMDTDVTEQLLQNKYLKEKYFKGVRHLIHDEADPKWLLQPSVLRSLQLLAKHDLSYDVVGVLPEHIETILKVIEKVPDLRMVFDHLNQPPMAKGEKFGRWGELMKIAVQHKNIHAKISGLGTATGDLQGWGVENIKPYIDFILENFGTGRCFCGGDWPVSLLAGSYTNTWNTYRQVLTALANADEQENIFYSNAERFYHL
jgi:L-fuconolactonase